MKDMCVKQTRAICNYYLLLTRVFIIHWILGYSSSAVYQCGEFSTNPVLSNEDLRFENNTRVKISFNLTDRNCDIKNTTHIEISMYNPKNLVREPLCKIVWIWNNSCRVPSFSANITCGCMESEWNYFFEVTVRGNTTIQVSVANTSILIPRLTLHLTTFSLTDAAGSTISNENKTTDDFTFSSERSMTTATIITDTKITFLTASISAGSFVITFIAGLTIWWKFKCNRQTRMQIDQQELEISTISDESNPNVNSIFVTRNANESDGGDCDLQCTHNNPGAVTNMKIYTRAKNCQNNNKGKRSAMYYLNPVRDRQRLKEGNGVYDEICEETVQEQRVQRTSYDHLH